MKLRFVKRPGQQKCFGNSDILIPMWWIRFIAKYWQKSKNKNKEISWKVFRNGYRTGTDLCHVRRIAEYGQGNSAVSYHEWEDYIFLFLSESKDILILFQTLSAEIVQRAALLPLHGLGPRADLRDRGNADGSPERNRETAVPTEATNSEETLW